MTLMSAAPGCCSRMGLMCRSDLSMPLQQGHHPQSSQLPSSVRPFTHKYRPLMRHSFGGRHISACRSRSRRDLSACCSLADRPHLQLATAKLPKYVLSSPSAHHTRFLSHSWLAEDHPGEHAACQRYMRDGAGTSTKTCSARGCTSGPPPSHTPPRTCHSPCPSGPTRCRPALRCLLPCDGTLFSMAVMSLAPTPWGVHHADLAAEDQR